MPRPSRIALRRGVVVRGALLALLLGAAAVLTLRLTAGEDPVAPSGSAPSGSAPWRAPPAAAGTTTTATTPATTRAGFAAAAPAVGAAPTRSRSAAAAFVPDRLLVGFAAGVPHARRAQALQTVRGRATGAAAGATVVRLAAGSDVERAAAAVTRAPGVVYAEPDYYRTLDTCDGCWQLGQSPGVNAASLHEAGRVGAGAVVAVLDDGVAAGLPELAGRVLQRRVCDSGCADDTRPPGGHGSVVATLIAAADDGKGTTGVAPAARIKSWRVLTGGRIPTSAVVAALEEVTADPEVTAVNMSFSGPAASEAEQRAVGAALAAGKTLVGSSGNDGSYRPQYPAGYLGVLSVGAVDAAGEVPAFSSYGKLDVVAPGVCVPVAAPPGVPSSGGCAAGAGGVVQVTGTSFAAPMVTGVLALRSSGSVLRDRVGLEGTAASPPEDPVAAKLRGHGLVDAAAWDAAFAADAAPYLVVEADRQLPHPDTTVRAYLVASPEAAPPPAGGSAPAVVRMGPGSAPAALEEVEPGVYHAAAATGPLSEGFQLLHASADTPAAAIRQPAATRPPLTTVAAGGTPAPAAPSTVEASVPVRVLGTDDQAPGVPLVTEENPGEDPGERPGKRSEESAGKHPGEHSGEHPWVRSGRVHGGGAGAATDHDLDDVYAVRLAVGDTIEVVMDTPDPAIGVALFRPSTTDVLGQLGNIVADGTPGDHGATLTHTATQDGVHLLDVYAPGVEDGRPGVGGYQLTTTVTGQR